MPESLTDKAQAFSWFEAEHWVLAVIRVAAGPGFDGHAWQIAWTTVTFFDRRGHWHDWAAVQRTALASARRLGDRSGEAYSHWSLGAVCVKLASFDEARNAPAAGGRSPYRELGNRSGEGFTRLAIAMAFGQRHRYDEALRHACQAGALFQAIGHRPGLAHAQDVSRSYSLRRTSSCRAVTRAKHGQSGDSRVRRVMPPRPASDRRARAPLTTASSPPPRPEGHQWAISRREARGTKRHQNR